MKAHEQEIRDEIERDDPFVLVMSSGDRIPVRGRDWIFMPPPLEHDEGRALDDQQRSGSFQVWSDGLHYRWVAFSRV